MDERIKERGINKRGREKSTKSHNCQTVKNSKEKIRERERERKREKTRQLTMNRQQL